MIYIVGLNIIGTSSLSALETFGNLLTYMASYVFPMFTLIRCRRRLVYMLTVDCFLIPCGFPWGAHELLCIRFKSPLSWETFGDWRTGEFLRVGCHEALEFWRVLGNAFAGVIRFGLDNPEHTYHVMILGSLVLVRDLYLLVLLHAFVPAVACVLIVVSYEMFCAALRMAWAATRSGSRMLLNLPMWVWRWVRPLWVRTRRVLRRILWGGG